MKNKNIHVLPTDKPSRLYLIKDKLKLSPLKFTNDKEVGWFTQNIYITNDEEIKYGDCILFQGILTKALEGEKFSGKEKVVLTTDQDLIKDGVQPIPDEFLEWFVKNPSCEEVEVTYGVLKPFQSEDIGYLIHCPDNEVLEKPKQENKVLVEMQQIPKRDSEFMGHYESCDLCHYNAFFKYLYNGEILYRCQGHKIVDINNLKSKFGFGNDELKQETLEELITYEMSVINCVTIVRDLEFKVTTHDLIRTYITLGAKWQKNDCVQFIDKLEDESFDGWSEEAISGYLTACMAIKEQFKKK